MKTPSRRTVDAMMTTMRDVHVYVKEESSNWKMNSAHDRAPNSNSACCSLSATLSVASSHRVRGTKSALHHPTVKISHGSALGSRAWLEDTFGRMQASTAKGVTNSNGCSNAP